MNDEVVPMIPEPSKSGRTRNRNAVVPLPRSPAAIALARDNGRYSRDGLRCPGDRNSAHAPGYDRHPLLRSSRPRLGTAGISPSRLRATLRGQHRGGPRCRGCFPLDPRRISQHASQGTTRASPPRMQTQARVRHHHREPVVGDFVPFPAHWACWCCYRWPRHSCSEWSPES